MGVSTSTIFAGITRYIRTVVVVSIVIFLVSLSVQQRSASGVPLPQAEQQRIENLAVTCTEAVLQNYYYGNITTITDENILAQCDDLFVDLKNQCDAIGFFMEQCSDPAYDKYLVDRGLSNRIEPKEQVQTAPLGPFGPPSGSSESGTEESGEGEIGGESDD